MRKRFAKFLVFTLLIAWTWIVTVYHIGVFLPPSVENTAVDTAKHAQWFPKKTHYINHLVVSGTPYERGYSGGILTRELITEQERALQEQLTRVVPSELVRRAMIVGTIRWFWGIEKYFDPYDLKEMLGVSKSSSPEFDFVADSFTRQVGYHGLHEVGQMMVDGGFACTLMAVPALRKARSQTPGQTWTLGRVFDFEGGDIFDREKIVKWIFPDEGYAYVSVIWAGMVGAVTGVNEKGVYISINSAGTDGFRRYGTPSTLIIAKTLRTASTAQVAVEMISNAPMIVADIFVVLGPDGALYRVEKGPEGVAVRKETQAVGIANHMEEPMWARDSTNEMRKSSQTTMYRKQRSQELVEQLNGRLQARALSDEARIRGVLAIMRDKKAPGDVSLPLGNRRGIDAFIATHGVIYDQATSALYISAGPALTGEFHGYDVPKSLAERRPVKLARLSMLPHDPEVTSEQVRNIRQALRLTEEGAKLANRKKCTEANAVLARMHQLYGAGMAHNRVLTLEADVADCNADPAKARALRKQAFESHPAYWSETRALQEKLRSAE